MSIKKSENKKDDEKKSKLETTLFGAQNNQ